MLRPTLICFTILLIAHFSSDAADKSLASLSIDELEKRRAEIEMELSELAHYSLRGGVGSIGYRSHWAPDDQQLEWAQIDFEQEFPIEEIVLVPTLWRDAAKGFRADGFPAEFRIVAGTGNDTKGTVIAEISADDAILPRIAPLVITPNEIKASWVRIETIKLSTRAFDENFIFQLSEVFVFSGSRNIALRCPVQTGTNRVDVADSWDSRFLVDGFVPYLMDASQGQSSSAFISKPGELPTLTIDLLESHSISQIQLHTVEQGDTVPQAYIGDLGVPRQIWIEGANRPDFSDVTLLKDYSYESLSEVGPILMWKVPETTCRYVRITSQAPVGIVPGNKKNHRIGFAEIALFSNGENVARGKPINADISKSGPNRTLTPLTDGNNLYGSILPIQEWLRELARRHHLENEQPLVESELLHRYAQQKTILHRVSWLAVVLTVGIGFTILVERYLRLRQITRTKERIAADLHDELGANLHTIGMLGDLAKESLDSPDELIELLDQSRDYTERSGVAVRNCTDMLAAEELGGGLVEEMTRSSVRILADLDHEITFEGEEFLRPLGAQRRSDLLFFYKECLINIIRHSGATTVSTQVKIDRKNITLVVNDNGRGFEAANVGCNPPASLERRARLLAAKVSIEHTPSEGTRITLIVKRRWWRFILARFRGIVGNL